MDNRLIEKTGDKTSPIGFGAMRLPLKNGKIDRQKGKKLIYHAIDNGINFIDTAAIYGNGDSEKFLGEILEGEYKDKVFISTKLPAYKIKKYEDMERILEEQLKRLNRNSIDYYMLHNIDLNTMNKLLEKDVLKFLRKSKKENKIKHVGFSYHGKAEEFPLLVDSYDWDCVMLQYNYVDNTSQINKEGIEYASKKGLGIFVMEPLKGGILAHEMPEKAQKIFRKNDPSKSNAQWSLEWLLNQKEITCIFSGMNEKKQIDENINIAKNMRINSLSKDDLRVYGEIKDIINQSLKINCSGCGYCMPCPLKINIPECIKIYNEKYLFNQKGIISKSLMDYYTTVGGLMNQPTNAGLCINCGKCTRNCPQNIDIPEELSRIKKEFEGHGFPLKVKFVKYIGLPLYQKFQN